MARAPRRILVLLAGLLAAGAVRLPIEAAWTAELRGQQLLRAPVEEGVRGKLGQTFFAVTLAGLRTLVATVYNLRVLEAFERQDWDRVYETYGLMVALAPRTGEYWTAGTHHQAMNAASYYRNDESLDMPPLRREAMWRASVLRGRDFAERGVAHVPEHWQLQQLLGTLLVDKDKSRVFGDPEQVFARAARAFAAAAAQPDSPTALRRMSLYALARAPSHRAEALAVAESLYADRTNHAPLLRQVYFALRCAADPDADPVPLALRVFGSEDNARRELAAYWRQRDRFYPMDGVALARARLGDA